MRLSLCLALAVVGCAAPTRQASAPAAAKPTRDPTSTVYVFEGVEVIGSRRYPQAELLALIGMPKPGTEIDLSQQPFWEEMAASKARLLSKYAFADCRYNLAAYPPTGTARIAVDVVEAGDEWRLDFLPQPTAELPDPEGLIAGWKAYEEEKAALQKKGEVQVFGEPTCRALGCVANFGHPRLAQLEERFIQGVPRNHAALVQVLREDKDDAKRMIVASLLVYGTSREEAVQALLPSIRDPYVGTRNEALRSLGELQHRQPRQVLPLEPILDALWYPSSSDRNKAAYALLRIVEATGRTHARLILERSGEMLAVMTGLHTAGDHEPALKVLEALSGEKRGYSEAAWRAWLAAEGIPPRTSGPTAR